MWPESPVRGGGVEIAGEVNNDVFENKYFSTRFLLPRSHRLEQLEARVKGVWVLWVSRITHQASLRTGLKDQPTVTAHKDTNAQRWEATHSKAHHQKRQTVDLTEAATAPMLRKDFSYDCTVSYSFKQCLLQRDFGRLLRDVF